MNDKSESKIHYISIGIISIVIVIIVAAIFAITLYKIDFLDWYETIDLVISLSGGVIGCVGTIFAVMLTIYQTNKLQIEERNKERKRLAIDNMPVFTVGRYSEMYSIKAMSSEVIRNDELIKVQGVIVNFIIKNISSHQAFLTGYSIKMYYAGRSLQAIYPGEKISNMIDESFRDLEKEEIGYCDYTANKRLVELGGTIEIKQEISTDIDIFEIRENKKDKDNGDVYAEINIYYMNMIGQKYSQALKIIVGVKSEDVIFMEESIPSIIEIDV